MRNIVIFLVLIFSLTGCDKDASISSSDGGTLSGDGGAKSAQYAGTYSGNLTIIYKGDDINDTDVEPFTIKIKTNGTFTFTLGGETISGVINGNELDAMFRITQTDDGIKCKADITIAAKVKGNSLSGPVSGSAKCTALVISSSAKITGSLSATKS